MKWSEKYKINANDTDLNNIVSVSNILRYMQDTANCHMEAMKPSYNDLFERGLSFILSRIRISLYSPLESHDIIESQSWACESRGVMFNRCYRIIKDGKIAAEAAKQSGRGRIPQVKDFCSFSDAVQMLEDGEIGILFYEKGGSPLSHFLSSAPAKLALFIGPEGGWESEEIEQARTAGIQIATLGPRILRTETAPLCALSAAMYACGELE